MAYSSAWYLRAKIFIILYMKCPQIGDAPYIFGTLIEGESNCSDTPTVNRSLILSYDRLEISRVPK